MIDIKEIKTVIETLTKEIKEQDLLFYGSQEQIDKYHGKNYNKNIMSQVFQTLRQENKEIFDTLLDMGMKETKSFRNINILYNNIYKVMLNILDVA